MDNKILNARELAQVRRIAQNVDADYQKVCKLNEQVAKLIAQRDELQQGIDEMEAPVIRKTGGYKSTDIYEKTIIPQFNEDGTPKTDKEGRQLKVTKYTLRYPDTIIPTAESIAKNVDAVKGETVVPPTTEDNPGSDFDIDNSFQSVGESSNREHENSDVEALVEPSSEPVIKEEPVLNTYNW